MNVERNSYYPNHQAREELRNSIAAQIVYGAGDSENFALKTVSPEELEVLGVDEDATDLIGEPFGGDDFKNAVYRDYVSGKYVLSFAGTDPSTISDWETNINQGLGYSTESYTAAMEMGDAMKKADGIRENFVITGHSLGGGLASAASMVSGVNADTFNSAGLLRATLEAEAALYPDALNNYDNNAGTLVDAYFLDLDILSHLQDHSLVLPMEEAIGTRHEMTGPWSTVQLATAAGSTVYMLYLRGIAHTSEYYYYGLMVGELVQNDGGDIYGANL